MTDQVQVIDENFIRTVLISLAKHRITAQVATVMIGFEVRDAEEAIAEDPTSGE